MATRKKSDGTEWSPMGEPNILPNGTEAQMWMNAGTGEKRLCPVGMHPTEQPNALPMIIEDDEPDEVFEETATDRVAAMLRSADGQDRAQVKVYRMNQGVMEYCQGFAPTDFEDGNFDMIRERFGAGEYMLRLYATNPATNKYAVRSATRIKIAESKVPLGGSGNELPNGLSQVLSTIAQGQQQMLSALVEMKQAPQKDATEEMTKMLNMMTLMRQAMGLDQQSSKSSIGEIVTAIRELRGAAEEISPPKDEEPDSLMGMLPKVLDMVSAGQQQQIAQQAAFAPVQMPESIAAAPIPAPEPAPQPGQQGDNVNVLAMVKLKAYLKTLINMAIAGDIPQRGADFVYDKLPDELVELLFLDNWFELLSAVAPETVPHKDWLTAVRSMAMPMFEGEDAPEENQPEPPQAAAG